MTTRIVLILVPTVALAALGLCLFWRLCERDNKRTSRRQQRRNTCRRDSDAAGDGQAAVVSRVGRMF